ncbi:MAG: FliH/SctL family protein [Ilumatobacter sp.]|jgi:flagellar assembly protein FliH|uniref:FliH/SctL family protein n=1 Tax=Ilumatobacter sp. TaxID=1967498 RepID=UPI00391C0504
MSVVDFAAPAFPSSEVVSNVRREAAAIAAQRRDAGFREGYELGMAEARADVDAAIADHRINADRLARCVEAFEAALADLRRRDALTVTDVESDVVAMAVELAAGLVGRELEHGDDAVLDAMRRALAMTPERGAPMIRVHPDDEATAREAAEADLVRWGSDATVVADARVERGGCIVDLGGCRIDAQVSSALDRLRDTI